MSLYLTINILSLSVPFLFSFHPKIEYYKVWKGLFTGILIIGGIFIAWDAIFTHHGIWGFNDLYIGSASFLKLPLEELLFFVCIPYSSVFIFYNIYHLTVLKINPTATKIISYSLLVLCLFIALIFSGRAYTSFTAISLAITLLCAQQYFAQLLSVFYVSFVVILLPFFLVNGVLTGTGIAEEVVWYNNSENLGIRLGTIPVEDIFYGFVLLFWISVFTIKISYHEKRN